MPTHMITAKQLMGVLLVSTEHLRRWRQNGMLPATKYVNGQQLYSYNDVDSFLAGRHTHFTTPPTAERLLTKKLQLLEPTEACTMLGITKNMLNALVDNGQLPAIQIGTGTYRLDKAAVEDHLLQTQQTKCVTRQLAAHALGVSMKAFYNMIQADILEPCNTPGRNSHENLVTQKSVLARLGLMLPPWIPAHMWLKDRQGDPRPLLDKHGLQTFLGVSVKEMRLLMNTKRLRYIRLPDSREQLWFCPISADELLAQMTPLSDNFIGWQFGETAQTASEWKAAGLLVCTLHVHSDATLYKPCLLEILSRCLSPGTPAGRWYGIQERTKRLLLTLSELSAQAGVPQPQIIRLAQNGQLLGVHLPGSKKAWRFPASQVRLARKHAKT